MWKTFQDFLWPHSNLQIKVMWAPLQYIVFLQSQETFPGVSIICFPKYCLSTFHFWQSGL